MKLRCISVLLCMIIINNNNVLFTLAGRMTLINNNNNNDIQCNVNVNNNNVLNNNVDSSNVQQQQQQQQPLPMLVNSKTSGTSVSNGKSEKKLPNILLVVLDDVGYNDLGSFSKYAKLSPRVPYMEKLMDAGVRLTSFYTQPICSPTRGALMTGRYPIRWRGQHSVATPMHPTWVPEDEAYFPELLQEIGYYTAATGKWHLGHGYRKYSPVGRGFHEFYGPYMGAGDHWNHTVGKYLDFHHDKYVNGIYTHNHIFDKHGIHSTTTTEEFALKIIEAHDDTNAKQPLFLYMPFQAPHMPTQDHEEYINRNMHIRNYQRRGFAGMMSHLDDTIQRVVEKLKSKNNMWENTLMILFADNGGQVTQAASNYPLRGTKSTPWEGGVRVPAFISGGVNALPDSIRGSSFDGVAHVTDIFPTLREMLVNKMRLPNKELDGISFWNSLITGSKKSNRDVMLLACDPYKRIPGETMRSRSEALKELEKAAKNPSDKKVRRNDVGATNAHAAIRVGKFKYIEGLTGRDEWFGADPTLALHTPVWKIGAGNSANVNLRYANDPEILRMPNTNQRQYRIGEVTDISKVTTKFLFDLETDPFEENNLYDKMPENAKEIQSILEQYKQEQLPPWDTLDSNGKNPWVAISHAGKKQRWAVDGQYVFDFWEEPAVGAQPVDRTRKKQPQSKL